MTKIESIQTTLEKMKACQPFLEGTPAAEVVAAFWAEGLAACDAMPKDRITGGCCYQVEAETRFRVISAILRRAGLLQ